MLAIYMELEEIERENNDESLVNSSIKFSSVNKPYFMIL